MILVTGGAGFIGANFVLDWLAHGDEGVVNPDKLTYAGNLETLASLNGDARHVFVQGDIGDSALVDRLLAEHRPRAVVNFAAESHVDRSIHGHEDFVQTNVFGTFRLLESVRGHWNALATDEKAKFRLLTFGQWVGVELSEDNQAVVGTARPSSGRFAGCATRHPMAGRGRPVLAVDERRRCFAVPGRRAV
jgi:NAD(P)-dependent dehydrogenase (short-subunit alcohol dehydrogenase family)